MKPESLSLTTHNEAREKYFPLSLVPLIILCKMIASRPGRPEIQWINSSVWPEQSCWVCLPITHIHLSIRVVAKFPTTGWTLYTDWLTCDLSEAALLMTGEDKRSSATSCQYVIYLVMKFIPAANLKEWERLFLLAKWIAIIKNSVQSTIC